MLKLYLVQRGIGVLMASIAAGNREGSDMRKEESYLYGLQMVLPRSNGAFLIRQEDLWFTFEAANKTTPALQSPLQFQQLRLLQ